MVKAKDAGRKRKSLTKTVPIFFAFYTDLIICKHKIFNSRLGCMSSMRLYAKEERLGKL
jgi:hypothetical protein